MGCKKTETAEPEPTPVIPHTYIYTQKIGVFGRPISVCSGEFRNAITLNGSLSILNNVYREIDVKIGDEIKCMIQSDCSKTKQEIRKIGLLQISFEMN